jgi:hypothetical protein
VPASQPRESPIRPASPPAQRPLGIIINPVSGRDARRLFARASSSTHESKRNQVERLIVGAVSGGVERIVLVHDGFRIADSAVAALGMEVEIDLRRIGVRGNAADTVDAVNLMREADCGALAVLGGDGTCRIVARTWPDATLLALSTGTNNVFPQMLEATVAGAAVGLLAAGRVSRRAAARRAKVVRVEVEGEDDDLALIDAVQMLDDSTGNLLPYDPERMRSLVLSRALPDAVGMSPVGGLLEPCMPEDDFGVFVRCAAPGEGRHRLLAPISPGLYRQVEIAEHRRLALGERVALEGPGLIACDGDRERALSPGQPASLRVERDGPYVIDAGRALAAAAADGIYLDRTHWHDRRDGTGFDCC